MTYDQAQKQAARLSYALGVTIYVVPAAHPPGTYETCFGAHRGGEPVFPAAGATPETTAHGPFHPQAASQP